MILKAKNKELISTVYMCWKLVNYKHILNNKHYEPVRCPKPKRHAGACWGGSYVMGYTK